MRGEIGAWSPAPGHSDVSRLGAASARRLQGLCQEHRDGFGPCQCPSPRGYLVDGQDGPGPVPPFQGVEAAVVLGKRAGLAEVRAEGGQHLAVDGIMTDHHHRGAAVPAGDVGQARYRPVPHRGLRLDAGRIIDRAHRAATDSLLAPVHGP